MTSDRRKEEPMATPTREFPIESWRPWKSSLSATKGACPAGDGHQSAGTMYCLPHDVPPTRSSQDQWRFCNQCNAMFYDGFPTKGACPAGDGHQSQGFMFVLPYESTIFDQG